MQSIQPALHVLTDSSHPAVRLMQVLAAWGMQTFPALCAGLEQGCLMLDATPISQDSALA